MYKIIIEGQKKSNIFLVLERFPLKNWEIYFKYRVSQNTGNNKGDIIAKLNSNFNFN